MQGQRGAIGSLPETLSFEPGSSSSDPGVADASDVFLNSMNQEGPNITMWNMSEPSSISVPNQAGPSHIEPRPDRGWPALMKSCPEPHQYEPPASMLSLGSRPERVPHNITVNPSTYRGSNGSSSSSFSDPFGPSSDLFELDGPLSRKRKSVELTIGQSSSSSGTETFQNDNENSGVESVSNENLRVENAHRNVRLRISSSGQQDPFPANNNPSGQSNVSSPRFNPVDFRSLAPETTENPASYPGQPVLRIPALRRHLQSTSRWNRNSSLRPTRSSNITIPDSRTIPTNISDHPLFIQPNETRNDPQTEVNWSLNGVARNGVAENGVAENGASSSHRGSLHYPPRRLSEFLRRSLLSASGSEGGGGRNPNVFPAIPSPAAGSLGSSLQDIGIQAGVSVPGGHHHHNQVPSRSSVLVGRQLDAAFGFPYLSRAMAAGNEGRGRLVSEIRSVLDLMRRGEPLRFEDFMILDQSVLYGVGDIHDRHRDMRLDIDNMSYEEILALEERIGNVNTGLTEETILKHLNQKQYLTVTGQPDAEPCCICQEEYNNGDDLGALECGHDFHHSCIKQWLLHKNLCPICKKTAFAAK